MLNFYIMLYIRTTNGSELLIFQIHYFLFRLFPPFIYLILISTGSTDTCKPL